MIISLTNYLTTLPKELLKAAEKCPVRECDESPKGHFVAYVDEEKESFDVSIIIEKNQEISAHNCDCKNGNKFCKHKAALLAHVAKGKEVKSIKTGRVKKLSKTERLLDEVDFPELKLWVKELLAKNKDTELAFVQHFDQTVQVYTPAQVSQITTDAIRAVSRKKKNFDQPELKKIVDLWAKVHKPIVDQYLSNVADELAFLNFHTLLDSCIYFSYSLAFKTTKIAKYLEDLMRRSADQVNSLQSEISWEKAVRFFINFIITEHHMLRTHVVQHLRNIFDISSPDRKLELLELMAEHFGGIKVSEIGDADKYARTLYGMVIEQKLFSKYFQLFRPLHFDNEFNLHLLEALDVIGKKDLAIKYGEDIIRTNFREEYNLPYLKMLKKLYGDKNDRRNLARVTGALFPYNFNYEDFVFVSSQISSDDERRAWRNQMLARAVAASQNYDLRATEFCFLLLDAEKNYKKMIGVIDANTPVEIISRYADQLAAADVKALLRLLIYRTDRVYGRADEKLRTGVEHFARLFKAILKNLPTTDFKKAVALAGADKWRPKENGFMEYVVAQLEEGILF